MPPKFGLLKSSLRKLAANHLASVGILILVVFVVLALAAPVLTRLHVLRAPDQQDQQGTGCGRTAPPRWRRLLARYR
jgi:flagellar basal body-associated protein FliL